MARAQRISEIVRRPKRVKRIQLTLTEGEADFLIAVLAEVGGHEKLSPRKYERRIYRALCDATGFTFQDTDAFKLMSGRITFDNYADPDGGHEDQERKLIVNVGGPLTREQAAETGRQVVKAINTHRAMQGQRPL